MTFNSSLYKLTDWRLGLPVNADGDPTGTAAQINNLVDFEAPGYFFNATDGGMVFQADVIGAKTGGSQYARSELREMDGTTPAAWGLSAGATMTATLKVTETPLLFDGTPGQMVIGQIHGKDAELVRLYFQDGVISFANDHAGPNNTTARTYLTNAAGQTTHIGLGDVFSYKIDVHGDQLTVVAYCNGEAFTSVTTISSIWNTDKFYFKAGVYLGVNETSGTGRGSATFYGLDYDHGTDDGLAGLIDPSYGPTDNMVLTGSDFDDVRNGGIGNDRIDGLAGNDILYGNAGNDEIWGGAGNDRIDGGYGNDVMVGAGGNDRFYVNSTGDTVREDDVAGGYDTVTSDVSFTLGANLEVLRLIGGSAIDATGNEGNNTLYGNRAANVLDGAGGADRMFGGDGDDTYHFSSAMDRAYELAGSGHDTIYSAVNLILKANLEDLTLTGTAQIGKGNELDNVVTGNAGNNRLYGLAGNDTLDDGHGGIDKLVGGTGNDTYMVSNSADVLVELAGQGDDVVFASVDFTLSANIETLNLTGSAINGNGNATANVVRGSSGANILDGKFGNDTLFGGDGPDAFLFSTTLDSKNNVDQLADFKCTEDQIYLSHDIFSELPLGVLQKANFVIGTQALTADQHIIYDKAAGDIYYDADGSGAGEQILFAHIRPNAGLYYPDFEIL